MKRVLVVYGSTSGCTKGVADAIVAALDRDGVKADLWPAASAPPAEAYDAVVLGSGVRGGRWHAPARAWLEANATLLRQLPLAVFTVGLTPVLEHPVEPDLWAATEAMLAECSVTPVDLAVFAGWNVPRRFRLSERLMLKVLKAPEGDFRDLPAIRRWAEGLRLALRLDAGLTASGGAR